MGCRKRVLCGIPTGNCTWAMGFTVSDVPWGASGAAARYTVQYPTM